MRSATRPSACAAAVRPVVMAVVGTLVVLAAVYLLAYLMAGDKLPKNAQISGIAVGGLSRAVAIDKLTTELGPRATAPMDVTINDKTTQVSPAEAGLTVDYAASVDAAGGGRSFDPRQIAKVLTGGSATSALMVVDEAKLSAAVQDLAAESDQPPGDADPGVQEDEDPPDPSPAWCDSAAGDAATVLEDSIWSARERFRCQRT